MTSGNKKRGAYFLWVGFDLVSWFRVLARYRFKVGLRYLPVALAITAGGAVQSLLRLAEKLIFGRRIARTAMADNPVFIIGHWRTGTTYLHELLAQDSRFTYPTTYECFAPHHFLVSKWFAAPLCRLLLPATRIQDNMPIGLDRPQEDEFALSLLGVVSPYLNYAFPQQKNEHLDFYDLDRLSPKEARRWENAFTGFLKKITFLRPRPLVLKSPTHTFRIATLIRLFPRARFIYLVRNPHDVYLSTMHLWDSLAKTVMLQEPGPEGMKDHVFEIFNLMDRKFEQTRHLIPPGQLCMVRYEDLETDPLGQLRRMYEHLGLGSFDAVEPALKKYLSGIAGYCKNSFTKVPETHAEVLEHWGPYLARYGYDQGRSDR